MSTTFTMLDFEKSNPEAHQLYLGKPPRSYRGASADMVQLIERYSDASGVEAKQIKSVLFQTGAHLNDLAHDKVTDADITADEFFQAINAAAKSTTSRMTAKLHPSAVKLGVNRKLKLPKMPKKVPMQDK